MTAINWALGIIRKAVIDNEEEDLSLFSGAGPVSLFSAILLGAKSGVNPDFIFLGIIGLILCMKLRTRGLVYTLLLLLISSLIKHCFFLERHLWQLGIEFSVAMGFALTAAAAELMRRKDTKLVAKIESQAKTVRNLEEDLGKTRQDALDEQIVLRNRIADLQNESDDFLSEISSLQILNDVLRKTATQTSLEREEIAKKFQESDFRNAALVQEIAKKVQESDFRNAALMQEIDEIKIESARLQTEAVFHLSKLNQSRSEIQEITAKNSSLLERLALLEKEYSAVLSEKEQMAENLQALSKDLKEQEHWINLIAERDQVLKVLQERVQALAHQGARYWELKKQFEEKNQVLHQTRVELFQADTILQGVRLEQERQNMEPSFGEISLSKDLTALADEEFLLEQENAHLLDLVNLLSSEKPAELMERLVEVKPKAKKKSKKKKKPAASKIPLPEQITF